MLTVDDYFCYLLIKERNMKNVVTVLGLMLFLVACGDKKEFSGNPIVEGWYADPEGVVFDNEYWIYPTLSDLPPGAGKRALSEW